MDVVRTILIDCFNSLIALSLILVISYYLFGEASLNFNIFLGLLTFLYISIVISLELTSLRTEA
jgi:hypothetical protein